MSDRDRGAAVEKVKGAERGKEGRDKTEWVNGKQSTHKKSGEGEAKGKGRDG